jgi:hypothetical protein
MSDLDIFAWDHAGLLEQHPRGHIGGRSAASPEDLALQIAELFEFRFAVNRQHRAIEDADMKATWRRRGRLRSTLFRIDDVDAADSMLACQWLRACI